MTRAEHLCDRRDWVTPPSIITRVERLGPVVLDPCAGDFACHATFNIRHGRHCYGWYGDGLALDWRRFVLEAGGGLVFVNPPFGGKDGAIYEWLLKIEMEARLNQLQVVLVCPASTGAVWFDRIWESARGLSFGRGREKYIDPRTGHAVGSATFWTCVAYWGPYPGEFARAFDDWGRCCFWSGSSPVTYQIGPGEIAERVASRAELAARRRVSAGIPIELDTDTEAHARAARLHILDAQRRAEPRESRQLALLV